MRFLNFSLEEWKSSKARNARSSFNLIEKKCHGQKFKKIEHRAMILRYKFCDKAITEQKQRYVVQYTVWLSKLDSARFLLALI